MTGVEAKMGVATRRSAGSVAGLDHVEQQGHGHSWAHDPNEGHEYGGHPGGDEISSHGDGQSQKGPPLL